MRDRTLVRVQPQRGAKIHHTAGRHTAAIRRSCMPHAARSIMAHTMAPRTLAPVWLMDEHRFNLTLPKVLQDDILLSNLIACLRPAIDITTKCLRACFPVIAVDPAVRL